MKIKSLRVVDYLDWLKDQEEYILYCLTFDDTFIGGDRKEYEHELQVIRELKALVAGN